ncbi:hypothetical protein SBOR_9416 [Sclerotinia borealis F-4128]|uniref:Peptidase S54 rhomboid domain-containing protein n=1 Tax=Sclerotinia borealis (strain F-4128) TaxID=1432307 RepID=W9C028_SCLBF|nr:hypothetical protein SBOR_9416 [Sclerotinia borealis F-4128]
MVFLVESRSLGLQIQKTSLRPVAQTLIGQISLTFRECHSTFVGFFNLDSPVRKSHLLKAIPSTGFRPFFSSTPLARGSQFRNSQAGKHVYGKNRPQQPQQRQQRQSQHNQDNYQYIRNGPPPPKTRRPGSSYPLAVAIAVGCTYLTFSYNQLHPGHPSFPLPDILFLFTPRFIERHFILSQRNIDEGRLHTLLTSSFIHITYPHLAMNMFGLITLAPLVNPVTFVAVWIGAGISCSLATLYTWKHGLPFTHSNNSLYSADRACGASGSVLGLVSLLAVQYPMISWQIMLIPIGFPAWLLVSAEAGYSVLALKYGWHKGIGHAGHLGGTAFGILAGIVSMRFGRRRF